MKNFYFAIVENIDGKKLAYAEKAREGENLLRKWWINSASVITVQPCHTRKEAERLADYWNDTFRNNNEYFL